MSTAIVITSGKGGTGKTSLTGGVASCLAALGQKVLCIDLDIGLRNLDISLGMTDRALMDFTDVVEGRCSLERAAVEHPVIRGLYLLTAPVRPTPNALDEEKMKAMLLQARAQFDYILIDSPAGLGSGFRLAVCGADRAVVVSTNDIHLVMNRIQPKLLRRLRTTIDDAMDAAGLPLLGVVPEDSQVILAANTGEPLILFSRKGAALAYLNIAKRLMGQRVPLMKIR